MSLQSIRSLDLFTTLAAEYISLISSIHRESIFLKELKECSKRIYGVPKFIYYALGYAINQVLGMSRTGMQGFLTKKVKPKQMNLFEHFKDRGYRGICILKMGKLKTKGYCYYSRARI